MIELLIVIVGLGILAAIVVFALGGITGKSVQAACQTDAKTVATGVAAFGAENPSITVGASADWPKLLTAQTYGTYGTFGTVTGSPFLQSWPTGGGVGSTANYSISVAIGKETVTPPTGTTGGLTQANYGDVLVTAGGKTYDATEFPIAACQTA